MEDQGWVYFKEGADCDTGIDYGLEGKDVSLEQCGEICASKGNGFMSHGRISSGTKFYIS